MKAKFMYKIIYIMYLINLTAAYTMKGTAAREGR